MVFTVLSDQVVKNSLHSVPGDDPAKQDVAALGIILYELFSLNVYETQSLCSASQQSCSRRLPADLSEKEQAELRATVPARVSQFAPLLGEFGKRATTIVLQMLDKESRRISAQEAFSFFKALLADIPVRGALLCCARLASMLKQRSLSTERKQTMFKPTQQRFADPNDEKTSSPTAETSATGSPTAKPESPPVAAAAMPAIKPQPKAQSPPASAPAADAPAPAAAPAESKADTIGEHHVAHLRTLKLCCEAVSNVRKDGYLDDCIVSAAFLPLP